MAESMLGLKRTCRCAELSEANIGQTVTVMGWVAKQRNKGGLVFVDLRDRSGIVQLIYEETECGQENFAKAEKMRAEFSAETFEKAGNRTFSAGVTQAVCGEEVKTLCMRVDDALYEAKRTGKNKTVVF